MKKNYMQGEIQYFIRIFIRYSKKTCKIVTLWNFYKQLRADHFGRSSSSNVKEDFFHIRKKPKKLIIKQETYFVCESKVCMNTFSAKVFRILSICF